MNTIRRGLYDWLNGEYEKAASITNRIAVFRDLVGRTTDEDMVQTVSVDGVVTGTSIKAWLLSYIDGQVTEDGQALIAALAMLDAAIARCAWASGVIQAGQDAPDDGATATLVAEFEARAEVLRAQKAQAIALAATSGAYIGILRGVIDGTDEAVFGAWVGQ
jgi:hypothetical protein